MTKRNRYVNAAKALPPELLAEIQGYVNNVYLWIPTLKPERLRERNRNIYAQWKDGVPRKVIARRHALSISSIHKIIQNQRLIERYSR